MVVTQWLWLVVVVVVVVVVVADDDEEEEEEDDDYDDAVVQLTHYYTVAAHCSLLTNTLPSSWKHHVLTQQHQNLNSSTISYTSISYKSALSLYNFINFTPTIKN